MKEHGFYAYVDLAGSAIGIKGDGEDEIVLLGHIDTVPGDVPVRLDGRKLYGRGTVDAKGALAAFAIAAADVQPPPGKRVIVIGATQEEAGNSKGARHALTNFNPGSCIIGEPSGWDRITLAYKGQLSLDWSIICPLAHSASPVLSAAEHAVGFWSKVNQYVLEQNVARKEIFDRIDISLIDLNTHRQGSFDKAEMQIDFRLPPDIDPRELEKGLKELVDGGKESFSSGESAFVAEKNTSVARTMLRSVRACGGNVRFVYKTGTSDMNVVGPVWRCPIVAYGPGDSRLDHTPDEHLDLDDFGLSVKVLNLALHDLLHGG